MRTDVFIKDSCELNAAKCISESNIISKQANQHKQQLCAMPSPEFVAKTLSDLREEDKLTVSEIKDQRDALSTLIKVGHIVTGVHMHTTPYVCF